MFEIKREEEKGKYCLSKVSILRDLCSILVIMASALSASTNPSAPAIDEPTNK